MQIRSFSCVLFLLLGVACSGSRVGTGTGSGTTATIPLTVSANPPPETYNGTLTVTLTSSQPALILATTDGSNPNTPSISRLNGQNQLQLTLTATTTINVVAQLPSGDQSMEQSFTYTRAGGVVGTATGVIVVGAVSVNEEIGLLLNGTVVQTWPGLSAPGQIPFTLTGLTTGAYQVQAAADRNGDGMFTPVIDYFSQTVAFIIDTDDPYHASDENITLYLGASSSGLCTIQGTITVPNAGFGESVSVSALNSGSLLSGFGGGGADGGLGGAQQLLTQLENGYQVFASGSTDNYPYAITNLQPGSYIIVPVLTSLNSGFSLNFLADILHPTVCTAGAVITQNFAFGPINLSGTVTLEPVEPPGNFVYGVVAARSVSLASGSVEAVLMPTFFQPEGAGPDYSGNFGSSNLNDTSNFSVRAFTSADPSDGGMGGSSDGGPGFGNPLTGGGPILSALIWALDPLSMTPAETTFTTAGSNVTLDFSTN